MKSSAPDKLLTISIPTYNREPYLDLCLSQFWKQIQPFQDQIEFIVSDNCSTDNTPAIVQKYIEEGFEIKYIRNEINLGADGNFEQCFRLATSKYFWLFCDDDLLLDEKLKSLLDLLRSEEYSNVYLNSFVYYEDFEKENKYSDEEFNYSEYSNYIDYLKDVNIYVTFGTGTIVNKSIICEKFDSQYFLGTNLNHVNWIFFTLSKGKKSIKINSHILACKNDNSGGYFLFKTFGENFRVICNYAVKEYNLDPKIVNIIDNNLICNFFPIYIIKSKSTESFKFNNEDARLILSQLYNKNFHYWFRIFPLYFLPKKFSTFYQKLIATTYKFLRLDKFFIY